MRKFFWFIGIVSFGGAIILLTGCTNTRGIIKAMGESNAALQVEVQSPWGYLKVTRLNPSENSPGYSVTKEGVIVTPNVPQIKLPQQQFWYIGTNYGFDYYYTPLTNVIRIQDATNWTYTPTTN